VAAKKRATAMPLCPMSAISFSLISMSVRLPVEIGIIGPPFGSFGGGGSGTYWMQPFSSTVR